MILTIVLTISSVLTQHSTVVYGNNYRGRNTTLQKHGPNVCAFEELLPGGNGMSATYRERYQPPSDGRQLRTCGQNTIFKYECCEGFKSTYGYAGCTGVKSPTNVLETAQELGAHEFVRYVRQNGLYDSLTTGGPYTIFVPTDEAFVKMDGAFRLAMDSYESAIGILKYHVVPRKIMTQNVSADEMLSTLNDGLYLRFNRKYSTKIETVNCVSIMRKNRVARNGVVHLINSVLNPYAYSSQNLVQVINQDRGLTIFSKMLEVSRVHQNLKEPFQTLTVLVPTDSAVLQQLPQNQLRRILNDEKLSKAFVMKHILPAPVCLSTVTEDYYVKSLVDKHYVKFSCDGTNSVTVQGKCVSNESKLSSGGMIYEMDFVLSTEEGKSTLQLMQQSGLTEFVQIIGVAGLTHTFENFNSLTVFAPTNKAIRCMNAAELYRIRTDAGTAKAFVNQHVGRGTTAADGMYDGQMLDSLAGGRPLRIQCVQIDCAVEGRALSSYMPVGYNGAVHAIDNVLCPAAMSIDDLIRRNDSFSLYVRAIDLLGPTWAASKFCGSRHNTYFVPTNYAFEKLDDAELRRTLDSPAYARRMLDNHRADRVLPSTLIKQRGWQYEFRTENEITVRMAYGSNGLTVNNVEIIETDIMTTDGLVHVVDDLILS